MARKPSGAWRGDLPALELECMKILWAAGELTVRDVRDRLHAQRPLAYTTVLTLLDRLARKGATGRRKAGRAHVYSAAYPQTAARERAVARLVDNFFGGSRERLLAHLQATDQAPARPRAAAGPTAMPLDDSLL